MPMKTKKIYSHYRMARSVLLSEEEYLRVSHIAAKLSVERGQQQTKSGIMREAVLTFLEKHELNGSKRGQCLPRKPRKPSQKWKPVDPKYGI